MTTCRGRTRVLAFVRVIKRATDQKRRPASRRTVAHQAFTLAEQADIVSAWKQGARTLRQACERFAVSYDAVVNVLEENEERATSPERRRAIVSQETTLLSTPVHGKRATLTGYGSTGNEQPK